MRASDADRNGYVGHLQDAFAEGRLTHGEYEDRMGAAYEAVTYADLYPLLADLPVAQDQIPGPPIPNEAPSQALASRARGRGVDRVVSVDAAPALAIFSETRRSGRWVVPQTQNSVAVFGSVSLDLRQAMLESAEVQIKAVAIFGEVKIKVPADIDVDVNGVGVFGEFARREKTQEPAPAGAARVKVTGVALFGSVKVTIVPPLVPGPETSAPAERTLPASDLPASDLPNTKATEALHDPTAISDPSPEPDGPNLATPHPTAPDMPPPVGSPIQGVNPSIQPPPLPPDPIPHLADPTQSTQPKPDDDAPTRLGP